VRGPRAAVKRSLGERLPIVGKLRMTVTDGYDGERLTEFVLGRYPSARRIQLRCD
jgi:hypothetical protein